MNWATFNIHDTPPDVAFESFATLLFERWTRSEFAGLVQSFNAINGAGGDGGLEAYVVLKNGDHVGLQCKWFRDEMDDQQFRQIDKSLRNALKIRPNLVRYCVAIPRNFTDDRGLRQKTQRQRWTDLLKNVGNDFPRLQVDLWDDARITELLSDPANEGVVNLFFHDGFLRAAWFAEQFDRCRLQWLSKSYVPNIHQAGRIEKNLAIRLRKKEALEPIVHLMENWRAQIFATKKSLDSLPQHEEFKRLHKNDELFNDSVLLVDEWSRISEDYLSWCLNGACAPTPNCWNKGPPLDPLVDLVESLRSMDGASIGYASTGELLKVVKDFPDTIRYASNIWQLLEETTGHGVYIGPPGAGKTHAFAHFVEGRVLDGFPALLLRAKDVDPSNGWASVLRQVLDRPTWTEEQLLNALDAVMVRTSVLKAGKGASSSSFPDRLLIAIDALDESRQISAWAERLSESGKVFANHSRIVVVASIRHRGFEEVLQNIGFDAVNQFVLPMEGNVAPYLIFEKYKKEYKIDTRQVPDIKWAFGSPLAVRLFADLYRGRILDHSALASTSLARLFKVKLERAEEEYINREGFKTIDRRNALTKSLRALATGFASGIGFLPESEAIDLVRRAQQPTDLLDVEKATLLLEHAVNHGLLDRYSRPSMDPLQSDEAVLAPAYNTLLDYLLAGAVNDSLPKPGEDGVPRVQPEVFRDRPEALQFLVTQRMLAGEAFVESNLFKDDVSPIEREDCQLKALAILPAERSELFDAWVQKILTSSMPACRRVLRNLVIPISASANHPFNARWLSKVLSGMKVADRDLFWSGPSILQPDGFGPWEGFGSEALETVSLASTEPWWGRPLLLAWGTSTVVFKERRRIREVLARWGADSLSDMLCLLREVFKYSNDPQMHEDLAVSAFGAVCLATPRVVVPSELISWIHQDFFRAGAPFWTDNSVVRHALRGIVERTVACGSAIDAQVLSVVRSARTSRTLLKLDQRAAVEADDREGIRPISDDLAWYVVASSIRPFFHEKITKGEVISPDEMSAAQKSAHQKILAFLKDFSQLHSLGFTSDNAGDIVSDSGQTTAPTVEHVEPLYHTAYTRQLHPRAVDLLSIHAQSAGVEELTPKVWAFAVLRSYLRDLGWNEQQFYGSPLGGQAGEHLGADIAITRQYRPATHGQRSAVSSFAEKYVWTGVHMLEGYLADTLPAESDNDYRDPPTDVAWVSDLISNPASDVAHEKLELGGHWILRGDDLSPQVHFEGGTPQEQALAWCYRAPIPNLDSWLMPAKESLPSWASDQDWVTLQAFIIVSEPSLQAQSLLWVSGFVVPHSENDAAVFASAPELLGSGQGVFASVGSHRAYTDPTEAVWAPWIKEIESEVEITQAQGSLSASGIATTTRLVWEPQSGETETWLPAQWLRKELRLLDYRDGRFVDQSGRCRAVYSKASEVSYQLSCNQALLVERTSLQEILQRQNGRLFWWTRLLRSPVSALFNPTSTGGKGVSVLSHWNRYWFASLDQGKIVWGPMLVQPD